MNIDFLFKGFKEFQSNIAIIWHGKEYTYEHLIENINKQLLYLESNQIKEGLVVAIRGDFSPNSIALLLSLIYVNHPIYYLNLLILRLLQLFYPLF